jgi:hypothetical protein
VSMPKLSQLKTEIEHKLQTRDRLI